MQQPIVLEVAIPEYKAGEKPDRLVVGPKIDRLLEEEFLGRRIVIRCIGSQDHPGKTVDELEEIVIRTGTDKYDEKRRGLGYEVGIKSGKQIDFFGTHAEIMAPEDIFTLELLDDFYYSTQGDRGYSIRINLVIIYDANKVKAVEHLYGENVDDTDGFVFREPENKRGALLGLIKVL
jgi:hypothetical protein